MRVVVASADSRSQISVLDMGGGTGRARGLWGEDVTYLCLDSDLIKVRSCARRHPDAVAFVSDGANAGIRTASLDIVLLQAVVHHVTDQEFDRLLAECRRVLKQTGKLVFLDPLPLPRLRSRLLWSIDRGSYPRPEAQLLEALRSHFDLVEVSRFGVVHTYLVCVGTPRPQAEAD